MHSPFGHCSHRSLIPLTTALLGISALLPATNEPLGRQEAVSGRVIDRLVGELERCYAFKGGEGWLIDSLHRKERRGAYAELAPTLLGEALTSDLRNWTADKHFMVAHMPAFAAELEAYAREPEKDDVPEDDPAELDVNFGVKRVEMLDERIGLIQLDRIAFSPSTVYAFQEALAELPDANALVLDLRNNAGGGGDTVPKLLSCFFPIGKRVRIGTRYWRPEDAVTPIETDPELPGVRYLDHPILILTSKDTRSAAEALAYHLRAFGRALVVGERTSGGAHPADMLSLGDGFVALLPMGIVTNVKTGTDWEGSGVPIDYPCPASEALEKAVELALRLLDED